jgi:hypothetical protein
MSTIDGGPFTITRNIDGSTYNPIRTTDNRNVASVPAPPVISPNSIHVSRKTSGATTFLHFGDTALQTVGGLSATVGTNSTTFNATGLPPTQNYLFTVMWRFSSSPGSLTGGAPYTSIGAGGVDLLTSSLGVIDSFSTFGMIFDVGNSLFQYSRFVRANASGVLQFTIDGTGTMLNSVNYGCDIWLIYLDPTITT